MFCWPFLHRGLLRSSRRRFHIHTWIWSDARNARRATYQSYWSSFTSCAPPEEVSLLILSAGVFFTCFFHCTPPVLPVPTSAEPLLLICSCDPKPQKNVERTKKLYILPSLRLSFHIRYIWRVFIDESKGSRHDWKSRYVFVVTDKSKGRRGGGKRCYERRRGEETDSSHTLGGCRRCRHYSVFRSGPHWWQGSHVVVSTSILFRVGTHDGMIRTVQKKSWTWRRWVQRCLSWVELSTDDDTEFRSRCEWILFFFHWNHSKVFSINY